MSTATLAPWVDILATTIALEGLQGVPVVMHQGMRTMPLIQSLGQVGWVHPTAPLFKDFVSLAAGQPGQQERLDASKQGAEVAALLKRAGLCVVTVPTDIGAAKALAAEIRDPGTAFWLVHGPTDAAGWAIFDIVANRLGLRAIETRGSRLMVSPNVIARMAGTPGGTTLQSPARVTSLAAVLAGKRRIDVHADIRPDTGVVHLRVRPDPVRMIAAGSESLANHVANEGRALFNTRGVGSLMLPWSGDLTVRLLCRNVRARIDDCEIGLGRHAVKASRIDYTDHGAIMTLRLPAVEAGRDALLHLSLPRAAVPEDGFCDIGACEFTVEMS